MRLIDADALVNHLELILHLNDYALQKSPSDVESSGDRKVSRAVYKAITDCIRAVDEQPTAFDLDKVVEQLKTKKTRTAALQKASEYFEGETDAFEVAIKIVKGGGVE